MNTKSLLIVSSALAFGLSSCATTNTSAPDPKTSAVVSNLVNIVADELDETAPVFVSDCTISIAMTQMALKSKQTSEQNMVMNLQLLAWSEVQDRQKTKGISVQSQIVSDFEGDTEASDIATKVADQALECTRKFTTGMKAANAKLKAEKEG